MDHPNAVYFLFAAHLVVAITCGMILASAFGIGPYKPNIESPRIMRLFKALFGLAGLVLGGYMVFRDLQSF